ncbi:unnamed protein product [Discula destructiva]
MADDSSAGMATTPPPHRRVYAGISDNDFDMTTLPDPRSRSITPANADRSPSLEQHPELSDEVAALSSKLIHAINHQTTLDDNLSQTRAELDRARDQIRSMELQLTKQKEMVAEEKRLRLQAEQEKKRIEQELENLTQELFEEANKMVISAKEDSRREQEIVHRKNDLLKAQLADTESLLKSQQDQLAELKQVMEQMHADRDDQTAITTPSSPGYSKFDAREDDTPTSDVGSQSGMSDLITPSYPTSFTHLLQPVLRNDISAYQDFAGLCETSRRVASRPPSGSHTTLSLGLMATGTSIASMSIPSTASTASLSSVGSPAPSSTFSAPVPTTPGSTNSGMPATPMMPIPPLKETKFYKRVLVEDVEPTLRLDVAPGLSWLARRSVITAMSEGTLVVEPVPTTGTYALLSKPQLYACSLCGENRQEDEYLRRYRFRTSESSSAQRYPLCRYCLNRVRATCDFLGFLRIVKDGHWRTDDDDAEKAAWEESVRLRENMFWTRIGGGVRPIAQGFQNHSHSMSDKSPRPSREAHRSDEISVEPIVQSEKLAEPKDITPDEENLDDFATPLADLTPAVTSTHTPEECADTSHDKSVVIHVQAPETDLEPHEIAAKPMPEPPQTPPRTNENRLSSQSLTPKSSEANSKITVTIPGEFP